MKISALFIVSFLLLCGTAFGNVAVPKSSPRGLQCSSCHPTSEEKELEDPEEGEGSCMSGQKQVRKLDNNGNVEIVAVQDLKIGDTVGGLDYNQERDWCQVKAVGYFGQGYTYSGYTDDHFVLMKHSPKDSIDVHGKVGRKKWEDKYQVLTSCPVGMDEDNVGFSAIDGDFCGSGLSTKAMSWKDYVILHSAILHVVQATGTFWFSKSSYKDFHLIRKVAPRLCQAMLSCANSVEEHCDGSGLEEVAMEFVQTHLKDELHPSIYERFPGFGQEQSEQSMSRHLSKVKHPFKMEVNTSRQEGRGVGPPAYYAMVAGVAIVTLFLVKKRNSN